MFWLGAIVSLCYVPGVTGAFIATQWPVLAIAMPFALLRKGPVTVLHFIGLFFLCYVAMHLLSTPNLNFSVFGVWLIWIMGLCVWFGTTIETGGTELRDLYRGLALGGAVSSVVAVFQWLGYGTIPNTSVFPAGIYVNSVQQGATLALIAVALISEREWRWVPFMLPGIVLSGSRGALVMLAVGLLGFGIRRVWLLGAVIVAGAAYMWFAPLPPSDQERMVIWQTAWHNLTWFGYGPGVFYDLWFPRNGAIFFPEHAHNDALQLAFEYGVGALPAFAIFAFALARTHSREWPVVLAFVVAGLYSPVLWMPVASFLALVAVGRILRLYVSVRTERDGGRRGVVSWRCAEGGGFVPVAPDFAAKG